MFASISDYPTRRGFSPKYGSLRTYFFILVAIVFGLAGIGSATYHFQTKEAVTINVDEKEAVGGQNGKYLIYAQNEVFDNRDSFWALKWNSSDVYRKIEAGNCYRTKAWGWRVPFLSMYRGIDQVEEISCN